MLEDRQSLLEESTTEDVSTAHHSAFRLQAILREFSPSLDSAPSTDRIESLNASRTSYPSMFTFTPLLGARSSSPALQSLLEFESGVKILIDVGWDVSFNAELLKELGRSVSQSTAQLQCEGRRG